LFRYTVYHRRFLEKIDKDWYTCPGWLPKGECYLKGMYFTHGRIYAHTGFQDQLFARRKVEIIVMNLLIIGANSDVAYTIAQQFAADFQRRGQGLMSGIGSVAGERGRQSNYYYGASKRSPNPYSSACRWNR
jgi:hypothetical protein